MAIGHNDIVNDVNTDIPPTRISFDVEAFDALLRGQGVKLAHYMATRCPVGMVDLDDNRRPHPDHEGCTNGFVYTKVGTVTALMTGNTKNKRPDDIGFWDGSTIQVTIPRTYDDCDKPIYVAPFDRFFLDEPGLVVVTWQLFKHRNGSNDRLKYPVSDVLFLKDASGVVYGPDDFKVVGGRLSWMKEPVQELSLGPGMGNGSGTDSGVVCSIRYTYRPWWYCGQLMHELRVSQFTSDTGRGIVRMPQAMLLHREYVVQSGDGAEPGSGKDADSFRTTHGTPDGGFGPR